MGIGVLVDIFKLPEGKTVTCDAVSPNDGKAMGEFLSFCAFDYLKLCSIVQLPPQPRPH